MRARQRFGQLVRAEPEREPAEVGQRRRGFGAVALRRGAVARSAAFGKQRASPAPTRPPPSSSTGSPTSTPTRSARASTPATSTTRTTRSRTSPTVRNPPRRPTRPRADMAQNNTLMGFVHRRRRGAELFLLILALAVGIGAYAAVGLGVEGEVPTDLLGYAAGWPRCSSAHTSWSPIPRRTPTRCCCRWWPPSTASAWPSSTGSTWSTRPLDREARLRPAAARLDDPRCGPVRGDAAHCCATTGCSSASPTPSASPRSCCCCCR